MVAPLAVPAVLGAVLVAAVAVAVALGPVVGTPAPVPELTQPSGPWPCLQVPGAVLAPRFWIQHGLAQGIDRPWACWP
jgi:hypothetical protein